MPGFRCLIVLLVLALGSQASSQQPESPLVQSFEKYQQMKRDSELGLPWIGIGPVVNSARVESVQLDPHRPGTMYVAFGSGNLWKTTNHGTTWRPLFENQTSHGIGDIALAPSNPNVIYLGTGESLKKARNFTIPGTGVYRSDDGGDSWRHLGLNDSWHIGEIAVHPENPDIALVAVLGHFWSSNPNRGLYRTDDGGKTWNHVLKIDDRTGANDVVWAKDNPNVVYASTWENYPGISGANSTVYRSDDGGSTWQNSRAGLPTGEHVGRIGLAVSQQNSDKVYALVDNREDIQRGAAQVYQSLNGGRSWTRTHESDLKFFSRIGWYFADIYVNPNDDDEIYALGVRVAHSKDGGKSFDYLAGNVRHLTPSAASGLHLDHCEMWIDPTNPAHLVLGNDGGLYESYDRGENWLHFNNLPTGEFYDLEIDQRAPGVIYAGAQDNATVFGTAHDRELGPTPWKYLWIDPWNGGDGCVTLVDPADSNTVYFSAQEGAFRRKDMVTQRSKYIRPQLPDQSPPSDGDPAELKFNFVAPMVISPHDPSSLYLGGNFVFKSTNRGDEWQVISPNVAEPAEPQRRSLAASAVAVSSLKPGWIYLGTDKGAVWFSDDDGRNWKERSKGVPVGYVRSIVPSRFSASRVYMTLSGLNYDDLSSHIYCSEDCGESWKSISANLPQEPANVIMEDPVHPEILYLGSFRGVYVSFDRGRSWSLLGTNLPACSIADLGILERTQELIVATHGRGLYKLNLAPLYAYFKNLSGPGLPVGLLPIPLAQRPYVSDVRPGLNFRPNEKTPISFWTRQAGQIKLTIYPEPLKGESDPDAEPVATWALDARKGLNQFRWDLVVNTTSSEEPYFINYRTFLGPGSYRVQLETESGTRLEQKLEVVNDTAPSKN